MMRRLALGCACAALLLGTGCDEQTIPRGAVVGSPAPEFAASDLQERPVSLADHEGRLVLLNVWATWCPPCREEIPALQELHETHVAAGLDVVGVSIDSRGERDNVGAFTDRLGVTYPIWLDPAERVTAVFRTQGVPTTFLIGRDGTVLWRHVGPVRADHPELNRLITENL